MTDTTVTTEAPITPLPNDAAARSPTGEILDQTANQPKDPSLTTTPTSDTPAKTPEPVVDKDGKPVEAKAPDAKAPDAYAAFKAPENYTLDPKAVEAALPVFKELGLTQDQAQRLVDLQTAREIELAKAPNATMEAMRTDWRTKVSTDPELAKAVNGDKTGLDAVKLDIGRALTHLPANEAADFRSAMDLTGAGDHPAFVKAFWKLSQLVTEGKHVTGGGPSPMGQKAPGVADRPSAGKALFPNLP